MINDTLNATTFNKIVSALNSEGIISIINDSNDLDNLVVKYGGNDLVSFSEGSDACDILSNKFAQYWINKIKNKLGVYDGYVTIAPNSSKIEYDGNTATSYLTFKVTKMETRTVKIDFKELAVMRKTNQVTVEPRVLPEGGIRLDTYLAGTNIKVVSVV